MGKKAPLIAVVEAEDSIRWALDRLVRSAGMDALSYSSGVEMISAVTKAAPDCIVLGRPMPGLSIPEIMELVPAHIPVVALSEDDKPMSDADFIAAIQASITQL